MLRESQRTHIHALIVCHLEDPFSSLAGINEGLHFGDLIDPWIHDMVASKPEAIVAEDSRFPEPIISPLHAL